MLSLPSGIKVYLATAPVDMRKSHDGLANLVQKELQCEVLSGHLFVFFNRKADRVKILYYESNGLCLWYKRLNSGRYRVPKLAKRSQLISSSDLMCLLEKASTCSKNSVWQ